jgi:AraC-like DNA-binding protein
VSEVINRYAGMSFHDLLTRRRVADVKVQLLDPANDRFTIEGIGAASGFGSRSAMYAAFRRVEGITPKEFRDRRRPSGAGSRVDSRRDRASGASRPDHDPPME